MKPVVSIELTVGRLQARTVTVRWTYGACSLYVQRCRRRMASTQRLNLDPYPWMHRTLIDLPKLIIVIKTTVR